MAGQLNCLPPRRKGAKLLFPLLLQYSSNLSDDEQSDVGNKIEHKDQDFV